jgi:lysophospholipase L1-like esterase
MATLRICFIGDSFVNGTGDPTCLGWTGRICAAASDRGHDLTYYNLGIRRQTSADIQARWQQEVSLRLPPATDEAVGHALGQAPGPAPGPAPAQKAAQKTAQKTAQKAGKKAGESRLVFSFGVNDTYLEAGGRRLSLQASLDHAQQILVAARSRYPTLMVGPPPVGADVGHNLRIAQLSQQLIVLCRELQVPYLEVFGDLNHSSVWMKEATAHDGSHPRAAGYGELADLVGDWSHWRAWVP